jgi:hypothetical protein
MGLTVSQFKFSYKGTWQSQTLYKKNDIVQYNNAAYICLQDVAAEMKIAIGTTRNIRSATDLRSRFSSWTVIVVSI